MKQNASRIVSIAVLVAAGIGLIVGMGRLLAFRFRVGDIFPLYSSLRADPLGTKVLYESLASFPELSVARSYRPPAGTELPRDCTLFLLGVKGLDFMDLDWDGGTFSELTSFVFEGGRMIIAMSGKTPAFGSGSPEWRNDHGVVTNRVGVERGGKKGTPRGKERVGYGQDRPAAELVGFGRRFGISVDELVSGLATNVPRAMLFTNSAGVSLPGSLSFPTEICFAQRSDAWTTVYHVHGRPVIVERKIGKGAIVLLAESYVLSNEAMRSDRYPSLLAWLIGGKKIIVFEESHLGVMEQIGFPGLLRRCRLEWFAVALAVLALLFIWQRSVGSVPRRRAEQTAQAVVTTTGRDAMSGLTNVLRRNISRQKLLGICLEEWLRSEGKHVRNSRKRETECEEVVSRVRLLRAPGNETMAGAYNEICRILSEGRHRVMRNRNQDATNRGGEK